MNETTPAVNFDDILSTSCDNIKKPKPLTTGTYHGIVVKVETGTSAKKQTPFVRFFCKPVSPMEDVDTEALEAVKGWNQKELKTDFYLTENSLWRLTAFLEQLGLEVSGRTLKEVIPEAINQELSFTVIHEIAQNGEDVFANIGTTAAAS